MLLRSLIVAAPSPRRRRILAAVDEIDSLVQITESIDGVRRELDRRPFDLLILELASLPDFDPATVREIRGYPEAPEVVVLTDGTDAELNATLVAAGCLAAVSDEIGIHSLGEVLHSLAQRRREEALAAIQPVPDADYRLGDYATRSPVMRAFLKTAKRVVNRDSTLLLLGETGVGKGLLARSMHNESPRAEKPFIAVNCGAMNETLLESELFGHERGAFTGADRARRGHFELAHTGTIFLDEIGEMPLHLQVKLLHVLEDRRVQPLGSEKTIPVDVRIMAATNKDLEGEVEEKRFRGDLYYRLNVISLTLPPLRERREDIPELAESYIDHFRATMGTDAKGIEPDAMRALDRYPWPGNLREFINAIERAVIMGSGEEIGVEDLPVRIQEFAPLVTGQIPVPDIEPPDRHWAGQTWSQVRRRVLEEAELRYLTGVLKETKGRIGAAAERAGMDPRSIREKMRRYGLRKEDFKSG